MASYDHKKIEKKWQKEWEKSGIYKTRDEAKGKDNFYALVEFPYPSGEGLHMGHLRPYVAGDTYSRYLRMRGKNVLYPIGWDAFGLPAENFAIKRGAHPSASVEQNIKNAKKQIKEWGIGFDWSREINTTDPEYYYWTQWFFLQFYKAGLAYEATGLINWCPKDKTGLADEEIINGCCERCGAAVEQKEMKQWYLKIAAYAEKLLLGLKTLDWPDKVKIQQENWIGRSEGALIKFPISNFQFTIEVFTTRPDTLFGATYIVLAPEHELIKNQESRIQNLEEIKKYIDKAKKKTQLQRQKEEKEKTGVELKGIKAINPANKEEIPVWIADYVLMDYGTGAIMAVPQHDERDREFAEKFKLPIVDRPLVDKDEIVKKVGGKKVIQYKLRDWVFSRQRYWGEPIPIIHCLKCARLPDGQGVVPVPEKDLPVLLPYVKKYEPTGTGESPLASIKDWVNVKCPKCGGPAKRETNTMPQWAGSSWYYLRYTDPNNKKQFADPNRMKQWLPVDAYFGGMEHTTLHLLYSRFWHIFLYDQGLVPAPEPYQRRIPHGLILGPDGEKMSKSRGNIVSPDEVVEKFGADALRMYEMFLGPHDTTVSWKTEGIVGIKRFLDRVWKLGQPLRKTSRSSTSDVEEVKTSDVFQRDVEESGEITRLLHKTIKRVGDDIDNFKFNTAISSLMILLNELDELSTINYQLLTTLLKLLAPFAPHLTEELWHKIGNKTSIHLEPWPKYDPKLVEEEKFELIIQINGKVRDKFEVPTNISQSEAEQLTFAREKVKLALENKKPRKTVFVPKRLINIVV